MVDIDEKKTRIKSRSIPDQIYEGEVIFGNYNQDETILAVCTKLGYTAEKVAEGVALLDDLKAKINVQDVKYVEQKDATLKLMEADRISYGRYMENLKSAQICFKNNSSVIDLLNLDGHRRHKFSKKIDEIEKFYTNVVREDVIAELTKFGITAENIASDKLLLDNVIALDLEQERAKGDARRATSEKNEAYKLYKDWITSFKNWLKLKLKDDSELLNKILLNN